MTETHSCWYRSLFMVSPVSLIATALILAGALLGIAALYEMAGDTEPDGQQLESIGKRRRF
jgi:hypothetical protein